MIQETFLYSSCSQAGPKSEPQSEMHYQEVNQQYTYIPSFGGNTFLPFRSEHWVKFPVLCRVYPHYLFSTGWPTQSPSSCQPSFPTLVSIHSRKSFLYPSCLLLVLGLEPSSEITLSLTQITAVCIISSWEGVTLTFIWIYLPSLAYDLSSAMLAE